MRSTVTFTWKSDQYDRLVRTTFSEFVHVSFSILSTTLVVFGYVSSSSHKLTLLFARNKEKDTVLFQSFMKSFMAISQLYLRVYIEHDYCICIIEHGYVDFL